MSIWSLPRLGGGLRRLAVFAPLEAWLPRATADDAVSVGRLVGSVTQRFGMPEIPWQAVSMDPPPDGDHAIASGRSTGPRDTVPIPGATGRAGVWSPHLAARRRPGHARPAGRAPLGAALGGSGGHVAPPADGEPFRPLAAYGVTGAGADLSVRPPDRPSSTFATPRCLIAGADDEGDERREVHPVGALGELVRRWKQHENTGSEATTPGHPRPPDDEAAAPGDRGSRATPGGVPHEPVASTTTSLTDRGAARPGATAIASRDTVAHRLDHPTGAAHRVGTARAPGAGPTRGSEGAFPGEASTSDLPGSVAAQSAATEPDYESFAADDERLLDMLDAALTELIQRDADRHGLGWIER